MCRPWPGPIGSTSVSPDRVFPRWRFAAMLTSPAVKNQPDHGIEGNGPGALRRRLDLRKIPAPVDQHLFHRHRRYPITAGSEGRLEEGQHLLPREQRADRAVDRPTNGASPSGVPPGVASRGCRQLARQPGIVHQPVEEQGGVDLPVNRQAEVAGRTRSRRVRHRSSTSRRRVHRSSSRARITRASWATALVGQAASAIVTASGPKAAKAVAKACHPRPCPLVLTADPRTAGWSNP